MAIGFRALTQSAAGGSSGASTISAVTIPSGTAAGDLVALFVAVKYASVTITPPSGWMAPTNNETNNTGLTDSGNDAGNIRGAIFFRVYDGVWSMPTITLSGAADVTMRGAVSYTKGAAEAWVEPAMANAVDNAAATDGINPAASGTTLSFTTGDWFGSYGVLNGDAGTFSSHTFTVSGVTFGAQNTRMGAAITTGTDLRVHSVDKTYTSGTAVAGPDGAVVMTSAAATCAGVMVFYRLRVAPLVTAVLAAPLNSLTASFSATVTHPPVVAVLAAPLGALTATATALPEHVVVLAAPLGGLSATGAAVPRHPAVLAAGLGELAAAITATPEHPATLVAPLGSLTATATATASSPGTTVHAVLVAPLGGLAGTTTAVPEHPVTAVAACGGLAAAGTATVRHSAAGAAPLGGLTATAAATVSQAATVTAVLVADLGQLVAMANAGEPPPPIASVGFERFEGPSPAWGEVVSWVDALNEPMWEDFQV